MSIKSITASFSGKKYVKGNIISLVDDLCSVGYSVDFLTLASKSIRCTLILPVRDDGKDSDVYTGEASTMTQALFLACAQDTKTFTSESD